jgi:hypothetical protein
MFGDSAGLGGAVSAAPKQLSSDMSSVEYQSVCDKYNTPDFMPTNE